MSTSGQWDGSALRFYIEIMTREDNPAFQRCMESIRYKLTREKDAGVVRVLGSYSIVK